MRYVFAPTAILKWKLSAIARGELSTINALNVGFIFSLPIQVIE
jgi:hypothetical protein